MTERPIAAIILAAGKGTRMKSDLHKVLHPIAGRPMIEHLLASVEALGATHTVVVVGSGRAQLEPVVARHGAVVAVQEPQEGTAHAVLQAQASLAGFEGDVLVLYGDVPLVRTETMARMVERLRGQDAPAAVVLGFRPEQTLRYGRIIADGDGTIRKMVEHKDASDEERRVQLCNSGMMAVRSDQLWPLLRQVGNDNAAREYYLPDIVMVAAGAGHRSVVVETAADEVSGVNSRGELAEMERRWQSVRAAEVMDSGVTLIDPARVWFAHDTQVGRDTVIEPDVFFGPGVTIGEGVRIKAFSHIEGAIIGDGAQVGPFARLRPGTELGANTRIGNFVEAKKARLAAGAKANHLTYLGDTEVGEGANIGAGTITCNYDGFFKYKTSIGAGAFIGSNSALVAPVTIGDGAIVGAGSVVTKDVSADALALVRPEQRELTGWAAKFRKAMQARKKG